METEPLNTASFLRQGEQQAQEMSMLRRRLDEVEAEKALLNTERDLLAAELDAVRKASVAEKLVLHDYLQSVQNQIAELPELQQRYRSLAIEVEDVIAAAQAESHSLACLVDVVEHSHFWSIKRWINRMRSRMFRIGARR